MRKKGMQKKQNFKGVCHDVMYNEFIFISFVFVLKMYGFGICLQRKIVYCPWDKSQQKYTLNNMNKDRKLHHFSRFQH